MPRGTRGGRTYLTIRFAYDRTTGSFATRGASFDSSGAAAAAKAFDAGGPVIPGAYGVSHTFGDSRIVCAGPLCVIASTNAANVTESIADPMCVTLRVGQTFWMRMLDAPSRDEVGLSPVCGCTTSSVDDRTVVQPIVFPGVRPARG